MKTKTIKTGVTRDVRLPRVLVVDDEPNLVELMTDVVGREVKCRIVTARSVAEAKKIMAGGPVDLMVTDVGLPDGDGMSLVAALGRAHPAATSIVITGSPTMERAISALRLGAMDFVAKPFTADVLVDRMRKALARSERVARQDLRMGRLRSAVHKLNGARKVVSKKVDLLCNDLIKAYGELSRQFDDTRTTEAYRKTVNSAKDLEQVLCHTMDWLLRQLGYSNVAIWLAGDDKNFQLGAYMKYTVAGEPPVVDALSRGLLPLTVRHGSLHWTPEEAEEHLTAEETKFLAGQSILTANCTYLGEALAAVVLFRDGKANFTETDAEVLRAVSPIFALALAGAVRDAQDAGAGEGADEHEDAEDGPKGKRDVADWWKRGEAPPF